MWEAVKLLMELKGANAGMAATFFATRAVVSSG